MRALITSRTSELAQNAQLGETTANSFLDRLFLLGDVVDRGPKSKELLNWVLATDYVQSVMGNHELMFVASSFDFRYREKHRLIGGEWVDKIDFFEYRKLTAQCVKQMPLTITLACERGNLGLVHAQSPADNWQDVQQAALSDRFAIDCTWPWNRAQGPNQAITGVTAVVSGHIGTAEVVRKGNQVWIDTLEQTGNVTLVQANEIFDWVGRRSSKCTFFFAYTIHELRAKESDMAALRSCVPA